LPISADQFYVDEDAKYNPGTKGEAAAITSAKSAAEKFVHDHPESQVFAKTN